METETTKQKILAAFETVTKKTVAEICRAVGIQRGTFYFHFRKDADFRREFIKKQIGEKLKAA